MERNHIKLRMYHHEPCKKVMPLNANAFLDLKTILFQSKPLSEWITKRQKRKKNLIKFHFSPEYQRE